MKRGSGHGKVRFEAWCCAAAFLLVIVASSLAQSAGAQAPQLEDTYADVRPYLEDPLKQILKRVPDLNGLQPSQSQAELPVILRKTGERIDNFFRQVTDVTAREDITLVRLRQEQPSSRPELTGEKVRDSYLILRHRTPNHTDIVEYRTDAKGDSFDQIVVKRGFIVTSGFALSCNYFSTAFQPESNFRYLGEQKLDSHDTYVVGFAQRPAKATLTVRMRGRSGVPAQLLVQGIAWIDKTDYQIVRLRTDLLSPRWDVGLNQQTTEVTFNKVPLAELAAPLWLPSSVKVYVEFTTHNGDTDEFYELSYRNEHRYSDYRRYRVATKVTPQ